MKPYDPQAVCEKCGCNHISTTYRKEIPKTEELPQSRMRHQERREHLFRECGNCTYSWVEATLEAQPQTALSLLF